MTNLKKLWPVAVVAAILIAVLMTLWPRDKAPTPPKEPPADPHAGQVQVNDGAAMVWLTPEEGVEVSPLTKANFMVQTRPHYMGSEYTALRGIDASDYQGHIDWQKVKASGMDFVILRCAWRGYGQAGTLHVDDSFYTYVQGARDAGLEVGVYIFSQAVTPEEAAEEADHVLEIIEGLEISLPVFWDWERIHNGDTARTDAVDKSELTDMAKAFCDTIREGGHTPGIYFNRQLGYYAYRWAELPNIVRWVADYNDYPDFYYFCNFWQYTDSGTVEGIDAPVDENMLFVLNKN